MNDNDYDNDDITYDEYENDYEDVTDDEIGNVLVSHSIFS